MNAYRDEYLHLTEAQRAERLREDWRDTMEEGRKLIVDLHLQLTPVDTSMAKKFWRDQEAYYDRGMAEEWIRRNEPFLRQNYPMSRLAWVAHQELFEDSVNDCPVFYWPLYFALRGPRPAFLPSNWSWWALLFCYHDMEHKVLRTKLVADLLANHFEEIDAAFKNKKAPAIYDTIAEDVDLDELWRAWRDSGKIKRPRHAREGGG